MIKNNDLLLLNSKSSGVIWNTENITDEIDTLVDNRTIRFEIEQIIHI